MTKILLVLLLCLAYQASSAIILAPVTFATDPVITPEPIVEPSSPQPIQQSTAPLNQTTSQTEATPQEVTTPLPSENESVVVHEEEPVTLVETSPIETTNGQSEKGEKSEKKSSESSEQKNDNKKNTLSSKFDQKKESKKSKRQIMVNSERSIVLMKEFPQKNAILPSSNVDSAEKTIVLQQSGSFDLSFEAHTVQSQVSESIKNLTLVVSLNDKVIEIPLEPGNSHKIVTLSGEQGPNQVVFTLKYDGKSKGIVSVILNMFEVQ